MGAGIAWAQPGWQEPPTPCDTLRPINLHWRQSEVAITPQLVRHVVARLDSAVSVMPSLDNLWQSTLRAMVLDSTAIRCPELGCVSVELPEVTHATLDIHDGGVLLQVSAYEAGKRTAHRYLSLLWVQAPGQAVWEEEILDHQAQTILQRRSDDGSGVATLVIATDQDRIVEIQRYRDDQRVGMQYLSRKGKDVWRYVVPGAHTGRTLYLDRPADQAIWQREGNAFYNEAFNFYFRLPEPLLAFGTPAARSMTYESPFED